MKKIVINDINSLNNTANLFKNFADSTRMKILYSLLEKEKNVTEISTELQISQSAISHQLNILKINNLIKNRRDGKTIYYSIADKHVYNIIEQGIEHVEEPI